MCIDQALLLKSLTGIWGKRDKELSQLLLQTHNAGNCGNQPRGVIVHTPRSNGFILKSLWKAWKVGLSRNSSNNYSTCRKLSKGDYDSYDKDFAPSKKLCKATCLKHLLKKLITCPTTCRPLKVREAFNCDVKACKARKRVPTSRFSAETNQFH